MQCIYTGKIYYDLCKWTLTSSTIHADLLSGSIYPYKNSVHVLSVILCQIGSINIDYVNCIHST